MQARALQDHDRTVTGYPTQMRCSQGEPWQVIADVRLDEFDSNPGYPTLMEHRPSGVRVPAATLTRIGWLDQKGRVWAEIPSGHDYNGGSYTPLLVDNREQG